MQKRIAKTLSILSVLAAMVSCLALGASAAWYKDSTGWYYLNSAGQRLTSTWQKDSKGWCYIGEDGYMVVNDWVQDSKGWCYIGADGYAVTNCWKQDDTGWRYLDGNGSMVKNKWVKDSVGWCYVGANGYMVTNNWVPDSKGLVYIGANGYMVTNQWVSDDGGLRYVGADGYITKNKWVKGSSGWCYLGADGYMVKNKWVKDSTGWCYLNEAGNMLYNQMVKDSVGVCYVGANGYMVTGKWVQNGGDWFYFGNDGYMVKNKWVKDSVGWCYLDVTGAMVYNQSVKDSVGVCYVGANGYMVYNKVVETTDGLRYFGADGYMVKNKWIKDTKGWRYFGADGALATNQLAKDGSKLCYVGADGYMVYNRLVETAKGSCYVGTDGYVVAGKWVNVGGWRYFGADGYMVTNDWVKDSAGWCYLDYQGLMVKSGWVEDGGKWYYLNEKGYMVTGWQTIGGEKYYFYNNGIMATNTTIDGIELGPDGTAKDPAEEEKLPNAPEGTVLTVGLPASALVTDYDNNALTAWLEEQTGYQIEFVIYQGSSNDISTQIMTQIAAGYELPDILYGIDLSEEVVSTLGNDGYFADLTNYYREVNGLSENFWSRINGDLTREDKQHILATIVDGESGKIFSVPAVERSLSGSQRYQPWINQTWLDKLGLEMPTNRDELLTVLRNFKAGDPNGNGVADEIPLMGATRNIRGADVVDWLLNMFLYYDPDYLWQPDYYWQVHPSFTEEDYREALTFIHTLYEEELLSSVVFNANSATLKALVSPANNTAICGIFCGDLDLHFAQDSALLYDYAPLPLYGYAVNRAVTCKANTFISADCQYPAAAFEILMQLWSEEGSYRARYGEAGTNWVDADNGTSSAYALPAALKILDDPIAKQNAATWGKVASCFLPYADGEDIQVSEDISQWENTKNQMKATAWSQFAEYNKYNAPDYPCPTLNYTEEEAEIMAQYYSSLKAQVDRYEATFITGVADIANDAAWEAYLADLNDAGLKECTDCVQKAYLRADSCNDGKDHLLSVAYCSQAPFCLYCGSEHGKYLGHRFDGSSCTRCGAGTPTLTNGSWHHDGVTSGGEELDRMEIWLGEDGTGSIGVSYWALVNPDEEESAMSLYADTVEFNGNRYYAMNYGTSGEITYTVNGDTITLNLTHWGEPCGTLTLKKTAVDRYTVSKIEGIILDEIISETISVGSVFIWL